MTELSTSLEDYLEAVYTLSREEGFTRACKVSALLKVSKPSVNSAIKGLASRGLASQERYGYIRLTAAGQKAGAEISSRHALLKDFFVSILGMGEAAAEKDACRAEHALSRDALRRVGRLAVSLKGRRAAGRPARHGRRA